MLVTITSIFVHSVTFTNVPAVGDVTVVKADDTGALMDGVTFTLTGTSDIGNPVNMSCTTAHPRCPCSGNPRDGPRSGASRSAGQMGRRPASMGGW